MRILLTGTNGQVGGALLPALQRFGDMITPSRADFDLSKPSTLIGFLDATKPDLIINPAAYTAVDRAEDEQELAFVVNAKSPSLIAEWAARRRVPMMHFSTDYVFDGAGDRPWHEDSPTGPISAYGKSKLAGDVGVQQAGGPHLIVRTSWVYGHRGSNFLKTIVRLAKERKELRIVADQIGAPTNASAIASAVVQILDRASTGLIDPLSSHGGVVNVTCSGETTWYRFAVAIIEGLRSRGVRFEVEQITPISTGEFVAKAKRPGNSRLALAKLNDAFGISMPSWEHALDQELDLIAADTR